MSRVTLSTSYFIESHFNITLPSNRSSFKWPLSLTIFDFNFAFISPLFHGSKMPRPFQLPWIPSQHAAFLFTYGAFPNSHPEDGPCCGDRGPLITASKNFSVPLIEPDDGNRSCLRNARFYHISDAADIPRTFYWPKRLHSVTTGKTAGNMDCTVVKTSTPTYFIFLSKEERKYVLIFVLNYCDIDKD